MPRLDDNMSIDHCHFKVYHGYVIKKKEGETLDLLEEKLIPRIV